MAETGVRDVVDQSQSVGDSSSTDAHGNTHKSTTVTGGAGLAGDVERDSRSSTTSTAQESASLAAVATADLRPDKTPPSGGEATTLDTHTIVHSKLYSTANGQSTGVQAAGEQSADTLVNGDSASYAGSDDVGTANTAGTEGTIGSDTDQGKGTEQSSENAIRHERSNSVVKRAALFKPVSVTKNFLAKTGVAGASVAKPVGEKPLSSVSQTLTQSLLPAKPRLVAKLARDARTLVSSSSGVVSTGPDASKVWNRNRPVPPALPKQFTDEELKQQYGIHLATRLQADEGGKESKWADIDDDEDDWMPETVQWMDGTKSTMSTVEVPPASKDQGGKITGSDGASEAEKEAARAAEARPPSPILPAPGKTILRPGVRLQPAVKPGLVLKNAPDTPTESPKPKMTSSSKSPWAALPPVDKASPISFVAPAYGQLPQYSPSSVRRDSFVSGDARMSGDARFPLSPAREIAADDFDRSWRDSDRGNRELFNSQSGRYEPVKQPRRPSIRQESSFRPPSVLQRPTAQEQEVKGGGRRESSSAGDGSAVSERHASVDNANLTEPHTSSQIPPMGDQIPSVSSPVSTAESNGMARPSSTQQAPPAPQQPTQTPEEIRMLQGKLMQKSAETNKRRKEQEAQVEEAAKKERLRKKLEELAASTTQAQKAKSTDAPTTTASPKVVASVPARAEPQRPADSQPGHPKAASKVDAVSAPPTVAPSASAQHQLTPALSPLMKSKSSATSPAKISLLPSTLQDNRSTHQPSIPGFDRVARSWNQTAANIDGSATWGANNSGAHANPVGSVWAAPLSDKMQPLGNGSFVQDFSRLPHLGAQSSQHRATHSPGAIGQMPQSPRTVPEDALKQQDLGSTIESKAPAISHADQASVQKTPSPLAFEEQSSIEIPARVQREAAMLAWKSLPSRSQADDALLRERHEKETAGRRAEDQRLGRQEPTPSYTETFRMTTPGTRLGQRQVVAVSQMAHGDHLVGLNALGAGSATHPHQSQTLSSQINTGRGSRFFGPGADRPQQYSAHRDPAMQPPSPPRSASPPPPEAEDHPAFNQHTVQPKVTLPRPPAKVRLPPMESPTADSLEPVIMPPRQRLGPQSIAQTGEWQNRFRTLLSNSSTQVSRPAAAAAAKLIVTTPVAAMAVLPALAVASSTKQTFDGPMFSAAATVSLPQTPWESTLSETTALPSWRVESKPTVEELMEDREFGSSPTVNLPKTAYLRRPIAGPALKASAGLDFRRSPVETIDGLFATTVAPASVQIMKLVFGIDEGTERVTVRMLGRPEKVLPIIRQSRHNSLPRAYQKNAYKSNTGRKKNLDSARRSSPMDQPSQPFHEGRIRGKLQNSTGEQASPKTVPPKEMWAKISKGPRRRMGQDQDRPSNGTESSGATTAKPDSNHAAGSRSSAARKGATPPQAPKQAVEAK